MTRRSRRGMTLVETIVMLGLLGIFGTIAVPVFQRTLRGIRRSQGYAGQFEVGRKALRALTTHVHQRAALPGTAGPSLAGVDGGAGAAAHDQLTLTATDFSQLGRGTIFTVDYFLRPADRASGTPAHLMRRLTAPDGSSREVPVGMNVVGFDCAYLADGIWHETWDAPTLPEAVRLAVYMAHQPGARPRALYTEVNLLGVSG